MIIEEFFDVRIESRNIEHFTKLGYNVKKGDTIKVKSSHLSKGSHTKIKIKCDYCKEEFTRKSKDHWKIKNKDKTKTVDKDACFSCGKCKSKESIDTFFDGVRPMQRPEIKEKVRKTNLERYGTPCALNNPEIKKKGERTLIERYGVDNFFKVEGFAEIAKATSLKKYGYEHFMSDPVKKAQAVAKRIETVYLKGNAPTSRQQIYLHEILGGELNYPMSSLMLDIAFPEDKIYLEYQGSGHDLDVKLGKCTEEEFKQKEINRYYYMRKLGWKMIEVISKKDDLPNQNKIAEMLILSLDVLKNHSYISFDIDNNTVKHSGVFHNYDYGEIISGHRFRKIYETGRFDEIIDPKAI